ncbi:hypothetical protein HDU76_012240 [Blyttiomyces sp. JEL0837]|nr:hypothetical protein HDU76_012240 [Blyttiomyces sp. JEL0837]
MPYFASPAMTTTRCVCLARKRPQLLPKRLVQTLQQSQHQSPQSQHQQQRSLSSASPARSLGQARSNGSSQSSSSALRSDSSSTSNTAFEGRSWDEHLLAHTSFFCRHRPLVAPAEHHGVDSVNENVDDILVGALKSLNVSGDSTVTSTASKSPSDSIPGASVWVASAGSEVLGSDANADRYNDEYAKLFSAFKPFAPPTPQGKGTGSSTLRSHHNEVSSHRLEGEDDFDELTAINAFFSPVSGADLGVNGISPSALADAVASLNKNGNAMEAISIKKIRRKKMNKHKWKKHRRLVRDSTRYNTEKRKKSGPLREKQE